MKKTKRFFLSLIVFSSALFLTGCEGTPIESDDIINKLFPNVWATLAQLISFAILVVLMIFLVYKPVKKYLSNRREMLDNEVKTTINEKKKAEENRAISEKNIATSKKTASDIIDKAKHDAKKEGALIIDDANREAEARVEKADLQIAQAKKDAQKGIKDQIIHVAIDASKHLLKREVNSEDNQKIIDDFVQSLDSKDDGEK
jgi:F-type H+-transporting ATPase subunit b